MKRWKKERKKIKNLHAHTQAHHFRFLFNFHYVPSFRFWTFSLCVSLGQKPWTSSGSPVTWPIFSAFSSSSSKSTPPNHVQVSLSRFPQNWGYFLFYFSNVHSRVSLRHSHSSAKQNFLCLISIILPIVWNCYFSGISRKTQELYAIVFVARYLDLFTDFISVYNTFMKVVFIASSLAIFWCMRFHPMVRRSYDRDLDTFRHYFLVGASFALALILHEKFTVQEVPCFLTHSPFCTSYSLLSS